MKDCEILFCDSTAKRGEKMLRAMIEAAPAAGITPYVTKKWSKASRYLMSYGLGHPQRRPWIDDHRAKGGHVIGWDLGYWNREEPLRFGMRLTIDEDHPHRRVKAMLGKAPPERWAATGIALREDFDATGPVILCGMGAKQRRLQGWGPQQWERKRLESLRKRFPDRRILYRPKRTESPLSGLGFALGTIEDALRGASLLVCAHSNTAIDACIAGVPVECDDGAAFALYEGNPAPSRAERQAFLEALAWFQYNPTEAAEAWTFIRQQLSD